MFQAAPGKSIQFVGDTKADVAKEIQQLAEEAVDNVYGSVVSRFKGKSAIASAVYDVKITVTLEPK